MKTVRNESEVNVKAYIGKNHKESDKRHLTIRDEYQGFPADRFNKAVYNFCDELGANFPPSNHRWISLHARSPITALLSHCWNRIRSAQVVLVMK
jgi:hypothetical protein